MVTFKIEFYTFGEITIDGQKYLKDLVIYPDHIQTNWQRESGHNLSIKDIQEILDFKPDLFVIGQGSAGVMDVPVVTLDKLEELKIPYIAKNTSEAVDIFNKKAQQGLKVVGAFHLTC